jgi:predicted peptidase
MSKNILQLHLVATMVDDIDHIGEQINTFKIDLNKILNVQTQAQSIFLYHSKDDPIVPFSHSVLLKEHLPYT